jgi:hypothetical protein
MIPPQISAADFAENADTQHLTTEGTENTGEHGRGILVAESPEYAEKAATTKDTKAYKGKPKP